MHSKIKLVLVAPPRIGLLEGFTSGLISLANFVRDRFSETIDIVILDLGRIGDDEIPVENFTGEVGEKVFVGITTTTATYLSALKIAKLAKVTNSNCHVVFGGHHASPQSDIILSNHSECVDSVIIGEGERALLALLKNYPDITQVPNLAFLDGNQIVRNKPAELLNTEELDSLNVIHGSKENTKGKFDAVTYVSARGCPLSCLFCAVANQSIRGKSVEKICIDITELVRSGASHITIEDNFFAHNRKRTFELTGALKALQERGIKFTWDCQTRIESMVRPEVVEAMESAGCTAVYLGVEALTEENILFLGKAQNPKAYLSRLYSVLDLLFDSSIEAFLNLQIGIPNFNIDLQTRRLNELTKVSQAAARSGDILTIFPQLFVVYPGTGHFRKMCAEGMLNKNVFEKFVIWEDANQPIKSWLGRTFAHGIGGIPVGIMDREKLRIGEFAICSEAVEGVKNELNKWREFDNISIFDYGQHLAVNKGDLNA